MRFFKRLFKFLLFSLMVLILGGAIFSWTNIWVSKNHVGVLSIVNTIKKPDFFSVATSDKVIVIERKGFNWHWQRIIPGWTQLVVLPSTSQTYTLQESFALPRSALFVASNIRAKASDFIVDSSTEFSYSLDNAALPKYIRQHKTADVYILQSLILDSLKQDFSQAINTAIAQLSDSFGSTVTDNTSGIQSKSISRDIIITSLTRAINQISTSLPVTIHTKNIKITNEPNFELYALMRQALQKAQSSQSTVQDASDDSALINNDRFYKQTQSLEYYLYFMKELGKIVAEAPELAEVIQILPPKEVFSIPE